MKSISEITKEFKECPVEELPGLFPYYSEDSREGVKKLAARFRKKYQDYMDEKQRIKNMYEFENKYPECRYICGVDEVGRGPYAGPVMAGAVILPANCEILYLNDSKKLSEKKREELFDEIMEKAVSVGIGEVSNKEIDEKGIQWCVYEAMRQAVSKLSVTPDKILVDAVHIPEISIPQVSIIKGDAKSASIAAASIVAKVTRDRMMTELGEKYPQYGFGKNKGYGTREHEAAIALHGITPYHRKSYIHIDK